MDPSTTVAPRLALPSWRDPRLVVGVLLVLTSVLLGSWVVSSADRTRPVWAAAGTLAPGEAVERGALTVVQARVDAGMDGYLTADEDLAPDLVALRTVAAGELVPRSAVGAAADLRRRPVGLPTDEALPVGLVAGSQVDVWVSMPVEVGSPEREAPRQLASAAEVAEVTTDAGAFGPSSGATVQVLLAEDELRAALEALAADADVALVLVPGSTPVGG
ncbi:hypothetical protein [Quadrisphaera sp. DSM 44207]|uniref:hypothetical protein n=1 Tax=Quadrisphaera sp. DSM 44207 TaxID=1881057 RepID=UPI000891F4B8|nr:hypothetical protein [Quadrisphaera sp. DSM 44207]SDQ08789.1 hypothetical protein SAMN05428996_0457 [Quadrisphaera sp. DSM 44207]